MKSLTYLASCINKSRDELINILNERGFHIKNHYESIDEITAKSIIKEFNPESEKLPLEEKKPEIKEKPEILSPNDDEYEVPKELDIEVNEGPLINLDDSYFDDREEEIRVSIDYDGSISHTDDSLGSFGIEDSP